MRLMQPPRTALPARGRTRLLAEVTIASLSNAAGAAMPQASAAAARRGSHPKAALPTQRQAPPSNPPRGLPPRHAPRAAPWPRAPSSHAQVASHNQADIVSLQCLPNRS